MSAVVKPIGKLFGVKKPKPPQPAPETPKPTEPPSRVQEEVINAGVDTRRREKQRRGRAATILSGGSSAGDSTASIGVKTLLGS